MKKNKGKSSPDFKAIATDEMLRDFESTHKSFEVSRKAALITLARSRTQLVDGFQDEPDLLLDLIEDVGTYIDRTKDMLKFLECAQARLLSVGMVITGHDFKDKGARA